MEQGRQSEEEEGGEAGEGAPTIRLGKNEPKHLEDAAQGSWA